MSDQKTRTHEHSPLYELENHGDFISRHIGPRDRDIKNMLDVVGADSLDDLIASTLPPSIQTVAPLDLPEALPMRERCELLMQIDIWLSAYRELENDLVGTLCEAAPELDSWMASADRSSQARIA